MATTSTIWKTTSPNALDRIDQQSSTTNAEQQSYTSSKGNTVSNSLTNTKGSYNPSTGVYTSPNGNKQSMAKAPTGATIEGKNPFQKTYSGSGSGKSSGGSYNQSTGVYTSPAGLGYSMPTAPSGSTIISGGANTLVSQTSKPISNIGGEMHASTKEDLFPKISGGFAAEQTWYNIKQGGLKSVWNIVNPFNTDKKALDPFKHTGDSYYTFLTNQPSGRFRQGTISPGQSPFISLGELQNEVNLKNLLATETARNDFNTQVQQDYNKQAQFIVEDFNKNPQSYIGKPGVETQSVMTPNGGKEVITLTPKYFESITTIKQPSKGNEALNGLSGTSSGKDLFTTPSTPKGQIFLDTSKYQTSINLQPDIIGQSNINKRMGEYNLDLFKSGGKTVAEGILYTAVPQALVVTGGVKSMESLSGYKVGSNVKMTGTERIVNLGFGALDIGLGRMGIKIQDQFITNKLTNRALGKELESIGQSSFKVGNLLEQREGNEFLINGFKSTGSFSQDIELKGNIEKVMGSDLYLTNAQGVITTSGTFTPVSKEWEGWVPEAALKKQYFLGTEIIEPGSKGISFNLGEDFSASVGKGTVITKMRTSNLMTTDKAFETTKPLYHGTSDMFKSSIYSEGIQPSSFTGVQAGLGKFNEVYLSPDIGMAKGFAGRSAVKLGGKPEVINAYYPKNEYETLLKQNKGLISEIKVNSVPTKNLIEYQEFTPEFKKGFSSNVKIFKEEKYISKDLFGGYTKKYNENIYATKFGEIDTKYSPGKLSFNINPRNTMITKVSPEIKMDFVPTANKRFANLPREISSPTEGSMKSVQLFKSEQLPKVGQMPISSEGAMSVQLSEKAFNPKAFSGVSSKGLVSKSLTRTSGYQFGSLMTKSANDFRTSSSGLIGASSFSALGNQFKTPSVTSMFGASGMANIQTQASSQAFSFAQPQVSISKQTQAQASQFSMPSFGGFGGIGGYNYKYDLGIPFAMPSFGYPIYEGGRKKKKRKQKKVKNRPSFTADVLDLRGSLPKGGSFGITPFQLRLKPLKI